MELTKKTTLTSYTYGGGKVGTEVIKVQKTIFDYSSIFLYRGTRACMMFHAIRYATAQMQNTIM